MALRLSGLIPYVGGVLASMFLAMAVAESSHAAERCETSAVPAASSTELPCQAISRCGNLKMCVVRERSLIRDSPVAAISPDGRLVASIGEARRTIDLWDTETGSKLRTFHGHTGPGQVESLLFSANGHRVASLLGGGSFSAEETNPRRTLRVWDVATGRQAFSIPDRENAWLSLAYSPDGRWLASVSKNRTIDIANASDGRIVGEFPLPEDLMPVSLRFSADSRRIAAIDSNAFRIWTVDAGNVVASWEGRKAVVRQPFWWLEEKPVESEPFWLWKELVSDRSMRIARPPDYSDDSKSVSLSPSFRHAAIAYEKFVSIVALDAAKEITRIPCDDIPGFVDTTTCFSPDGERLALETKTYENAIHVVDVETGREQAVFRGHRQPLRQISFSADRRKLLATTEFRIHIWNVKTQEYLPYCDGHEVVTNVAFSPDGRFVASEGLAQVVDLGFPEHLFVPKSGDGVRVWETRTGRPSADLGPRHGLFFSPDSSTVLTWSTDGRVELHSLRSGRTIRTDRLETWDGKSPKTFFTLDGDREFRTNIRDARMTADSRTIAYLIAGRRIAFFDRMKRQFRFFPPKARGDDVLRMDSLTISDDGAQLLAVEILERHTEDDQEAASSRISGFASNQHRFAILDSRTGKRSLEYEPKNLDVRIAVLSSDAKLVAAWCEPHDQADGPSEIHIVDAENGGLLHSIAVDSRLFDVYAAGPDVTPLAFSPDGKILAAGGTDSKVRLWEIVSGKRLHEFDGHLGTVTAVAFSKDGSMLATGSIDSTVVVWDIGKLPE